MPRPSKQDDLKLVVWTIVGLVIVWAIVIPVMATAKPFGCNK